MAEPTPIISYSVDNDNRFKNALKEAAKVVTDLRAPFSFILADFYKSEQAIFKLKGPGLYPPISELYGARKESKTGFRYPLLVLTGKLAASVLSKDAPGAVVDIQAQKMVWGTSIPYAVYPQSDAPRKVQPLRKFLFIGPEATRFASSEQVGRVDRWLKILGDYVTLKSKAVFQ